MNSKALFIQTRRQGKTAGGFSLFELLFTLAIVGILMAVGLPELDTFMKNSRLTTQTNTFISVLNFARSEAISRSKSVFITANHADNANEWGNGWRIWVDGLDTAACRNNVVAGANVPNRTLEQNDAGCNEVLKVFDFTGSKVTIDMTEGFTKISNPDVTGGLESSTLMFRGGSGTPALKGGDTTVEFHICDDRTDELGRHIGINRITGRVTMISDAHKCS